MHYASRPRSMAATSGRRRRTAGHPAGNAFAAELRLRTSTPSARRAPDPLPQPAGRRNAAEQHVIARRVGKAGRIQRPARGGDTGEQDLVAGGQRRVVGRRELGRCVAAGTVSEIELNIQNRVIGFTLDLGEGNGEQAVKVGDTVYLSGQIPLVPQTMELVDGGMEAQIRRVFDNLSAVAAAAGGRLADVVKLNIYLVDLGQFALVNQVMAEYFKEPYPARAAVGVAALPRDAQVEMDAVMVLGSGNG